MKLYIIIILIILMFNEAVMAEQLRKVVELTQDEATEINKAGSDVIAAKSRLEELKNKIAKAHGLSSESYMEWSTRVEFDGGYILQYYESHMDNRVIGGTDPIIGTIVIDSGNPSNSVEIR